MLTRTELLTPLIALLKDLMADWDEEIDHEFSADTALVQDLGFESIDIIQLTVAIEEDFSCRGLPFADLLMRDGRYVDDISVGQLADFLAARL